MKESKLNKKIEAIDKKVFQKDNGDWVKYNVSENKLLKSTTITTDDCFFDINNGEIILKSIVRYITNDLEPAETYYISYNRNIKSTDKFYGGKGVDITISCYPINNIISFKISGKEIKKELERFNERNLNNK